MNNQSDWEKKDPGVLDNVIGLYCDREIEDSVEEESNASLLMSWYLVEISEREQISIFISDHSPKV